MRFSVLTSYHVWNKLKQRQLGRCVRSVLNQSYRDWEHILVDDGSTKEVELPSDKRLVHFEVPHQERIIALNKAFEAASGEWFVFLDSDDEFFSHSLECMSQIIDKYPDNKVYNYGSFHVSSDYVGIIRGPFEPEKKKVGHVPFGGGNIVNGTFFFHRECYEKLGGFPHHWNPWDFSLEAQEEYPEIKEFFVVVHPEHPEGYPKELGNPWGNDFYYFYKLTREYHSKPFNFPLVIIHHEGKTEQEGHYVP